MNKPFYQIRNVNNTPEVFISGILGEDADFTGFRNVIVDIIASGAKRCKMIINSGGGLMTEGFAIFDLLMSSNMVIEVDIIGMAASMAGVISQAASPGLLSIHPNASVMIHKPQSGAMGESNLLRDMADYSDKLERKARMIYMKRTGKDDKGLDEWFKPGTMKWFTAEEALAAGLVDRIITEESGSHPKPTNTFKNEKQAWTMFYNTLTTETHFTETTNMKKPILEVLNKYKVPHTLTEANTDEQFAAAVENSLKAKDEEIARLNGLVTGNLKESATTMVNAAATLGKIKQEAINTYIEKASKSPEDFKNVKELLDGIQGRVDVKNTIDLGKGDPSNNDKKADDKKAMKTFSQYSEGELQKMKENDLEGFKALFKAEYDAEWSE